MITLQQAVESVCLIQKYTDSDWTCERVFEEREKVKLAEVLLHSIPELLKAAKNVFDFRNTLLTRAGVAGCRETADRTWVRDPASQSFKDLGEVLKKIERETQCKI